MLLPKLLRNIRCVFETNRQNGFFKFLVTLITKMNDNSTITTKRIVIVKIHNSSIIIVRMGCNLFVF